MSHGRREEEEEEEDIRDDGQEDKRQWGNVIALGGVAEAPKEETPCGFDDQGFGGFGAEEIERAELAVEEEAELGGVEDERDEGEEDEEDGDELIGGLLLTWGFVFGNGVGAGEADDVLG